MLLLCGKPLAFIKDELLLLGSRFILLLGFGDRCNELGPPAVLDDLLGRLPLVVQLPVAGGIGVGGVQNGVFEEFILHGSRRFLAGCVCNKDRHQ